MTIEELKEFLQDDKNRGDFDVLVKSLGYETQDDIQGLKNKNTELVGKLKKIKDEALEKQKVLDNIDLDAYNDYLNGGNKAKNSDLSKAQRDLKIATEELDKFKKVDSKFNDVLIRLELERALEESGIDARHKPILTSAFLGKAKVEVDGTDFTERSVIIDDDGLGQSPKEYFKKWVETDTGKAYLAKPDNKGGHNSAFNASGSAKKITHEQHDMMTPKQRASFFDNGGELI